MVNIEKLNVKTISRGTLKIRKLIFTHFEGENFQGGTIDFGLVLIKINTSLTVLQTQYQIFVGEAEVNKVVLCHSMNHEIPLSQRHKAVARSSSALKSPPSPLSSSGGGRLRSNDIGCRNEEVLERIERLHPSSAESKVPNQTRAFFHGSLISAANRPHGRFLTPRNRVSLIGFVDSVGGGGTASFGVVGSAFLTRWRMGG
ncbi:hypothetical protein Lal_00048676 [Lupinus albus]|nr:hypothetical protein Lal_00048676 [Lupinus albus]